MSGVNITILEGGKAENFGQVTKLRTSNGSDHDLWVPKGDVETKHLSVKKNGLYYTNQYEPTASEKKDGKAYDIYGWDTITVSVKKKVTGKKKKLKPDGAEIDVPTTVEVDDDGNLVEKELPTSIEIQVPPSKLQYYDGESISTSGMVVKAYYADDTEWGTVPLSEITIDPTTATASEGEEYSDGDGVNALRIWYEKHSYYMPEYGRTYEQYVYPYVLGVEGNFLYTVGGSSVGEVYVTRYNNKLYACRISGTNEFNLYGIYPADSEHQTDFGWWFAFSGGTTYRTTNYFTKSVWNVITNVPESTKDPTEIDPSSLRPTSGSQTITVKWTPDGGEDELTDTFDITVVPHN